MRNQQVFPKFVKGMIKCIIMLGSMGVIGTIVFSRYVSWLYVLVVMVWGYFWLVKKLNQFVVRQLFRKGKMITLREKA